jgi:hypothetical protein
MHPNCRLPLRGQRVVRGARKLLSELAISTIATLIVTASLSNLLLNRPPAPKRLAGVNGFLFSPIPMVPANYGLEPTNIVTDLSNTGQLREKREPNGPRKLSHSTIRAIEPVMPATIPLQPPLQLSGAITAATAPGERPAAGIELSDRLPATAIVLKPIVAIAGQLSSLLPKF